MGGIKIIDKQGLQGRGKFQFKRVVACVVTKIFRQKNILEAKGIGTTEVTFRIGDIGADLLPLEKYDGIGVSQLRKLKQFEEKNQKLKQLVADLSLEKKPNEALSKKWCKLGGRL